MCLLNVPSQSAVQGITSVSVSHPEKRTEEVTGKGWQKPGCPKLEPDVQTLRPLFLKHFISCALLALRRSRVEISRTTVASPLPGLAAVCSARRQRADLNVLTIIPKDWGGEGHILKPATACAHGSVGRSGGGVGGHSS